MRDIIVIIAIIISINVVQFVVVEPIAQKRALVSYITDVHLQSILKCNEQWCRFVSVRKHKDLGYHKFAEKFDLDFCSCWCIYS